MKTLISAIALLAATNAQAQTWTGINETSDSAQVYTSVESSNIQHVSAIIYADKGSCNTRLVIMSMDEGWTRDKDATWVVSTQLRVDRNDIWTVDDGPLSIAHEKGSDGDLYQVTRAYIDVDSEFMAEMILGTTLSMRFSNVAGGWTGTYRFPLAGTRRQFNKLMAACSADVWDQDSTWKSNNSDNEWES